MKTILVAVLISVLFWLVVVRVWPDNPVNKVIYPVCDAGFRLLHSGGDDYCISDLLIPKPEE